jgi:DNA-binding protein HU-beta
MNNKEFIKALAEKADVPAEDMQIVANNFIQLIMDEVSHDNSVYIKGFGAFSLKKKAARKMYNPTTKENVDIPEKYSLAFKHSPLLKEKFNS